MFDEYSEFCFTQEDHGNYLHISVPGKLPESLGEKEIKWTGPFSSPLPKHLKEEAIRLKIRLKKEGRLENLPQKQLPGYSSVYSYGVAPMGVWEITPDLKDLIYIRNDVAHKMKHALWFPLLKKLQENIPNYDYIQLTLPKLPKVVTEELLNEWYKNNLISAGFVKRLEKMGQKTMIDVIDDSKNILVKPVNHPFVNQPYHRVLIDPNQPKKTQSLSEQDLLKLKQQVVERDLYLLKGLTDAERKKLSHINPSNTDTDYSHQLHWIQWPSLNGQMDKNNAIITTKTIAQMYQYVVQSPLECFLKIHLDDLLKKGKPVFVDLPVPYNGYRANPIKKIKTKHQNRPKLKHILQKKILEID